MCGFDDMISSYTKIKKPLAAQYKKKILNIRTYLKNKFKVLVYIEVLQLDINFSDKITSFFYQLVFVFVRYKGFVYTFSVYNRQ